MKRVLTIILGLVMMLPMNAGKPNDFALKRGIILSFHYYLPMLLTHYRASWNEYKDYAGPLHYPGEMVHPDEFAALSDREKSVVRDYVGVEWNIDRLKSDMADAVKVARKYRLQLFCGEWGVYETAPKEDK